MRCTSVFYVVVLVAASTAASAGPVINVGNHRFSPGETKTIGIYSTGSDVVQGVDLYVQIGDGGTANNGVDTTPIITTIDLVGPGTVFHASNTGQSNVFPSPLLSAVSTTTNESVANYVSVEGLLAYVTINTAGTTPGEVYPLRLKGVGAGIFGNPGVDTEFAGVAASITNGSITIVPEPSAPVLLCGLVAALPVIGLWRRYHGQQ